MAKQRASKKSSKKATVAKRKSAAKKKPVQKSAKSSKQNDGKKSSGVRQVTNYAGKHLDEQLSRMQALIKRGWPAEDIQIVLRYKTIGGVVEHRGTKEVE